MSKDTMVCDNPECFNLTFTKYCGSCYFRAWRAENVEHRREADRRNAKNRRRRTNYEFIPKEETADRLAREERLITMLEARELRRKASNS